MPTTTSRAITNICSNPLIFIPILYTQLYFTNNTAGQISFTLHQGWVNS